MDEGEKTNSKPKMLNSFKPRPYQLQLLRFLESGTRPTAWMWKRRAGEKIDENYAQVFDECVKRMREENEWKREATP